MNHVCNLFIGALAYWIIGLGLPSRIMAIYDPRDVPNNKYGIHVADPNDIIATTDLINSTGGDWGYVTIVIQDNDRNHQKWQSIFNQMRYFHLIPLVRLATHVEGDTWVKPSLDQADDWANFLHSLNWPIENKYIILFNEPNHAKEWGGTLDPEGYAETLISYSKALKTVSEDFFILPAGLDSSAASDGEALDAHIFFTRMVSSYPDILSSIDGWTSHSYPNPGFSASPYATGRGSIAGYSWEISQLQKLSGYKNFPVFITETGWRHSQGKIYEPRALSPIQLSQYIQTTATSLWNDPNIVAITPFIFSYQDVPFDHFSWKKLGSDDFYDQYYAYQTLPKIAGKPKQRHSYDILEPLIPESLVIDSSYTIIGVVKNTGQAYLRPEDGYAMDLTVDKPSGFTWIFDDVPTLEPDKTGAITYHLKTPKIPGTYHLAIQLLYAGRKITLSKRDVTIVPPPTITLQAQLGWKSISNANNVTVLIYDHDLLIKKFVQQKIASGQVTIEGVSQVVPHQNYRVVLLVPHYLPRQHMVTLDPKATTISLKRLIPLDFNNDGTLTIQDLMELFTLTPHFVLSLFFGP